VLNLLLYVRVLFFAKRGKNIVSNQIPLKAISLVFTAFMRKN